MATATKIQLVEFNRDGALKSIDVQSIQGEDIASKYEIRTVPALILADDGRNVVKRHSGLLGVQELKEFCNETN